MDPIKIGIIGGSGLYKMEALTDRETVEIDTPFGRPSDAVVIGKLAGQRVAFIPRHGKGHRYTPTEVPYAANIYALKTLGVRKVLGVSACGSLKEELAPGHIVIPDQLFDMTKDRRRTFFGNGLVAHVGVADPFCPDLAEVAAKAVEDAGGTVHRGGTFVTIEGPRFSTKGESAMFREWGFSIIGMTTSPEAYLAREAEMCYAVMAHITDYDVWHDEPVTTEMVVQTFQKNLKTAQQAVVNAVAALGAMDEESLTCDCENALEGAIMTDPAVVPAETLVALKAIVGRYFDKV
jgi:5'-methylthioadenosine phosphorylase